jgi:hypothetical protein
MSTRKTKKSTDAWRWTCQRFERWRRTRRSGARIPQSLWSAALHMARVVGVGTTPKLSQSGKRRLEKRCRHCRDAGHKVWYLIILNLGNGRSPSDTTKACNVHRSLVYRVAARFSAEGEDRLFHRRADNGRRYPHRDRKSADTASIERVPAWI